MVTDAQPNTWSMRAYRHGDECGIRELFRLVFGQELSAEQWNWMYRDNQTGLISITLAEGADGQLAGHYAVRPVRMKIGDEVQMGTLSLDTMVHPDYRRQGMFTKLAKHLYAELASQGIPLTYGFPNKNSYHGCFTKLDWVDLVGRLPLYVKVLNPTAVLVTRIKSGLMASLGGGLAKAALGVIGAFRRGALPDDCELKRVDRFDQRIDEFWGEASRAHGIMVARDRAYLNWRYVENPTASYELFIVEKGSSLAGYMVLKIEKMFGLQTGFIVDLLTIPDEPALASGMIAEAVLHFRSEGMDIVSCLMLKHTPYTKALKSNGFLQAPEKMLPQELYLGVRRHTSEHPETYLFNPRNWFITWGDHDVV